MPVHRDALGMQLSEEVGPRGLGLSCPPGTPLFHGHKCSPKHWPAESWHRTLGAGDDAMTMRSYCFTDHLLILLGSQDKAEA